MAVCYGCHREVDTDKAQPTTLTDLETDELLSIEIWCDECAREIFEE